MIYRVISIVTAIHLSVAWLVASLARHVLSVRALGYGRWALVFLAIDAVVLYAMLERRAPVFGRILWRGRRDTPAVALTFDDGPNEPFTSQILDALRDLDVKATFFIIGANAKRHPDTVRRIVADGHEIGNHTYDHAVLPLWGPSHIRATIRATSDAIERIAQVRPRLFRAPHGWRNPWVDAVARAEGLAPVAWTLGVFDTDRPGAAVIRARTTRGLSAGCIVLLHDGRGTEPAADCSQLVDALPGIIGDARARGYRLTTVGRMVAEVRDR